jgi:hypothetical protein
MGASQEEEKNNILTIFGSFINVNHGEKTPLAGDLKPTSG